MRRLLGLFSVAVMGGAAIFISGREVEKPRANTPPLPLAIGAITPRLSPDGRQIAVSYQGAICVVPANGGTMRRLTSGEGYDHEPVWSPDGKRIAFVRGPNQPAGEVRMIDAADGANVPLPKAVGAAGTINYYKLDFDPAGNRILGVFSGAGYERHLGWYDLETGAVKPTGITFTIWSRYALSADGKWIAYTVTADKNGEQGGNNGPQTEIWKSPADGGKAEKIVEFPSRVYDLCWMPDGKSLVVVSDVGVAYNDLWHVPLADPLAGMKRWTMGQADEDRPSVSRDGKRLVYLDNQHGATALVVRELANGREQIVAVDQLDFGGPTGRLHLQVHDAETNRPISARVAVLQDKGKYTAPPGALYRFLRTVSHFYCDRPVEFALPAGKYRLRAFRGIEYEPADVEVTIEPGRATTMKFTLKRWTHAAKNGWYSGENHIHANYGYGQWFNTPETILAQCAGEDLNVCNFMVANSDTDAVFDRAFFRGGPDPRSTPETILYWNQEFRSTIWGHMTLVNLKQVVEPVMTGFRNTTNPWDIPTNADVADRAHWQKGHVNYTHPIQDAAKPLSTPYSGKSLPIDVALGRIDSLDLNNFYSATVPVWYRFLNCGFRLAPSAGTDVFLNKIFSNLPGGDRLYVRISGGLSYSGWIDGLKTGRSFISNGPMLELTADGKELGEVIQFAAPGKVQVKGSARSFFPLVKVELMQDGKVVATVPLAKDDRSATFDQLVNVERSGWLALRASGPGHPDSPQPTLYAHTAPIYLEVAGAPARSREDAQFFLKWIDELSVMIRTRDRIPTEELKRHVEGQIEAARAVYGRIGREAK